MKFGRWIVAWMLLIPGCRSPDRFPPALFSEPRMSAPSPARSPDAGDRHEESPPATDPPSHRADARWNGNETGMENAVQREVFPSLAVWESAAEDLPQLAAFSQPDPRIPPPVAYDEDIPAGTVAARPVWQLDPAGADLPLQPLGMREVSESVLVAFPGLEAARAEMLIAEGQQLAAWGEMDLKLKTENYAAPLGFYENYRNLVKLEQGVLGTGGGVYGQYRIGDGLIQPWYGERETNEGGEFKAGFWLPLLRDRRIDQRRADILQTTLRRQQVEPAVRNAVLTYNLMAADAYWSWVAAGLSYDVQHELLRVTIERNRVYEERVRQNDLARIELVQNRRLIASREAKIIEAERKLQQAAYKLSIFLRDEAGQPLVPRPRMLPASFPEMSEPDIERSEEWIQQAWQVRPELQELSLQLQQAQVDLELGQNQRLPALNATVDASQDVGAPASSKRDKSPFELEAGVLLDVPLQRRKAAGKIREAEGKIAQLAAKQRLAESKIEAEVRDALSALRTSHDRVLRARESLALA
ncbi:MAG: TolC family protein, partial [Pirellulaceae bacterium]